MNWPPPVATPYPAAPDSPKGETTHYILRVAIALSSTAVTDSLDFRVADAPLQIQFASAKCVRCASTGKRLTCHPIQGENRTSLCFPVEVCSTMLSPHSPTSEAGGKVVAEPPKGVPLFHRPPGRLPGFIIMAPLYYFNDAHQGLHPRRVSGHMPLCRAAAGPFF